MGSDEAERRILLEFKAGNTTQSTCEACDNEEVETYRPKEDPESCVKTYCDECAEEISNTIIPSEEYHATRT